MTNMEMINALNALAAQTPKLNKDELLRKQKTLEDKKFAIKTYHRKYYLAKAKNKYITTAFSSATDNAYYALIKNLGKILPSSETDGQVGASFYLSTNPEKGEFVRVSVSRTNGVSAGKNCETETVEDALKIRELSSQISQIDNMINSTAKIEKLCKTLVAMLSAIEE